MSRRVSPSTHQVYGLQRVTRIWAVSRATVYRHRQQPEASERRQPGQPWCMDQRRGRNNPNPVRGQAMRT